MRTAITLARKHGEEKPSVLTGPEVPIDQQIAAIKGIAGGGREHPEFAEVELWTSSSGRSKRFKFRAPGEKPAATGAAGAALSKKTAGGSAGGKGGKKKAAPTQQPQS